MNELEAICMAQDENIKQKILVTRKLLNSLPKHPYGNYSKWARCLITCQSCGVKDGSAQPCSRYYAIYENKQFTIHDSIKIK